jgi:hypothetical protein
VIRISKTQLAIVIGTIAACSAACGPVSVLDGHGSTPGSTQQGKILTGDDSAADGGASNSLSEEDGVKIFAPNMSDGSLGGIVMAADTGSPLPSVQVTAVGACGGSGCTDATSASQVADGSGAYDKGTVNVDLDAFVRGPKMSIPIIKARCSTLRGTTG